MHHRNDLCGSLGRGLCTLQLSDCERGVAPTRSGSTLLPKRLGVLGDGVFLPRDVGGLLPICRKQNHELGPDELRPVHLGTAIFPTLRLHKTGD